ncbi:MAG: hypothetical protein WDO13_00300 [Verrucomicrobiota bacterium]
MWLLSKQSNWMPKKQRSYLLQGMKDWGAWIQYGERPRNPAFVPNLENGKLVEGLFDALDNGGWKKFRMTPSVLMDLKNRISASKELLKLPESTELLVQTFLRADCIKSWFSALIQRSRLREKATRKSN